MDAKEDRPLIARIDFALKEHRQRGAHGRDDDHDARQAVGAVNETFDEHDAHGDAQQRRDGHPEAEADDVAGEHFREHTGGVRGKARKTDGA